MVQLSPRALIGFGSTAIEFLKLENHYKWIFDDKKDRENCLLTAEAMARVGSTQGLNARQNDEP